MPTPTSEPEIQFSLGSSDTQPETLAAAQQIREAMETIDYEEVPPPRGLEISTHECICSPDGNTIRIQYRRLVNLPEHLVDHIPLYKPGVFPDRKA